MQIVDREKTLLWLTQQGIPIPADKPEFPGFLAVINSAIPSDSGKKTALSRAIASLFDTNEEALLWINEFGIWPSSEDAYLFHGFRRFLGEYSPLHEKPGHLFSKDDLEAIASLIAMMLYFVWGGVLYSRAKGLAIVISHDEFVTVHVRNRVDVSFFKERLKDFL
ncbi:MAG: hypothetical protein WAS50_10530 [Nitrospira sp.]